MDKLEFAAKVIEAVIWPATLVVATLLAYHNRGRSREFIGGLIKRLKELNVGSLKVVLAEDKALPPLSADIKNVHYRRYNNGIMVQEFKLMSMVPGRFPVTLPMTFPNEILSVQLIGNAPAHVVSVSKSGFVLDATQQNSPFTLEFIATGL